MKTKLLSFLFFLICGSLFAQPYIPMLNNSSWNLISANFGGNQSLMISNPTTVTIGAYTYLKYTDPTPYNSDNYVREDVANRKVYRYVNGADVLLYDFTLQVNQHIILSDGKDYRVTSISDVNVNGGTRKMFYLVHFIGSFAVNSEVWIEGVGSNRHPLKPEFEMFMSDPYIYVNCSSQNGVAVYNHGLANGGTASTCDALGLDDLTNEKQKITFAPNPFQSEFTVHSSRYLSDATVKVYNALGQLIKESKGNNGMSLTVSGDQMTNGIYFAQVFENGKCLATEKIILSN